MLRFDETKDKIPGSFTYPATQTDVQASLTEEPLLNASVRFTRFHNSAYLRLKSWRGEIERIPVIFCRYDAPTWTPTALVRESPSAKGRFLVYIYCVPRALRAPIRAALRSGILKEISSWVSRDHPETWYFSNHETTALYDTNEKTVALESGAEIETRG